MMTEGVQNRVDDDGDVEEKSNLEGTISKWTNYYHGWQDRYVCCRDGTLCYYRTRDETEYGCRGSISLSKAIVTSHELDPCRFDVCINDSTWYLRTNDEAQRQQWIDVIEANRYEGDDVSLRSESSVVTSPQDLKEKLSEIDTFRGILARQVELLQNYFGACAIQPDIRPRVNGTPVDPGESVVDINFKGEALTFKVTASEMQAAISDCIVIMQDREEMWRSKCEKLERELVRERSKARSCEKCAKTLPGRDKSDPQDDVDSDDELFFDPNNNFESKPRHRFADELQARIEDNLKEALAPPESGGWEVLTVDGDTTLYRRELVKDGVVCDPTKALFRANGVTGRELCYYFWETNDRMSWDSTIEELRVAEAVDDSTAIVHQVHRQVWPIAQRDCLYMSAHLQLDRPGNHDNGPRNTWMVCNFSVDHEGIPLPRDRIRAIVEVSLVCRTYVTPPINGGPITRDCLHCDVVYIAYVNPGGWAPAAALRAIGKREYPKFLRNLVNFVKKKSESTEIWL